MWPPPRKKWLPFDAKYAITTAIGAFCLSFYNTYVADLRTIDDVSVVIRASPLVSFQPGQSFLAVEPDQTFIFINGGTRNIGISSIFLEVAQPNEHNRLPTIGCEPDGRVSWGNQTATLGYDMQQFIVKPGEMLPKTMKIDQGSRRTNHRGWIGIPLSDQSKGKPKHSFRTCTSIKLITVDSAFNDAHILLAEGEFEDDIDNPVGRAIAQMGGASPISLIRNDHSIFKSFASVFKRFEHRPQESSFQRLLPEASPSAASSPR